MPNPNACNIHLHRRIHVLAIIMIMLYSVDSTAVGKIHT
jgi:hypothetical protein